MGISKVANALVIVAYGNVREKNLNNLEVNYKERISGLFTDGFEKALLNAAFSNLNVPNPLRFNNFAYSLRELLRHVLHRLSPDGDISQCDWFKPDPTSSTGYTRQHRLKYAIQGGLSDFYVTKKLKIDEIDDVIRELLSIIKLLSGYTHIESHTFDISESEVEKLSTECLEVTLRFVEKISETRNEILGMLIDEIDRNLLERIISESVTEIIELSTHQYIEDIYHDGAYVDRIGPKSLTLKVTGHLDCELQYGSGSDIRRGDGGIIATSFPFFGTIDVKFEAPLGSVMEVDSLNVDTSSWYE
ncbi:hypothetical protein [Aeromonas sp. FDAARGOS 1418]|uniref:pPIWI-associating nuclease domain-containing protein n=1 Tax=Aeromonas TaxID=642 RepID=UPI0015EBF126|nr:hypothetical protein [Aeromonas sp. FDAARGOS 1418]MBA2799153.1 hypothetical protein [Aeromonas veronii]QXB98535.1 hypothetical protein I6L48_16130 [Aeromonas sp. FDAARGOS 1418]